MKLRLKDLTRIGYLKVSKTGRILDVYTSARCATWQDGARFVRCVDNEFTTLYITPTGTALTIGRYIPYHEKIGRDLPDWWAERLKALCENWPNIRFHEYKHCYTVSVYAAESEGTL